MGEVREGEPIGKSPDIEKEMGILLEGAGNRLKSLDRLCEKISGDIPHDKARELKENGDYLELTYRCLPTLKTSLDRYRQFPVDGDELFDVGLCSLQAAIRGWNPGKRTKEDKPDYVTSFVDRRINRALKGFVSKECRVDLVRNLGGVAGDNVEEEVVAQNFREILRGLVEQLSPEQANIIDLRFGLTDGEEHTLEQIARLYEIKRDRVRQIEAKALRKLRHPSRSRRVKDFLH